ncbi:MAG: MBG domain-containing protein [Bacteroidota bacterium]
MSNVFDNEIDKEDLSDKVLEDLVDDLLSRTLFLESGFEISLPGNDDSHNVIGRKFRYTIRLVAIFLLLFVGMYFKMKAQTSAEAEPNNSISQALANGQERIFQPTTLTGTVSSGDDDIWLIGYDFSIDLADGRLWMFFDGQIPAGLTVERGVITNNATPYGGSDTGTNGVFTDCLTFDYTSFFEDQYAYLKISSSDGVSRSYSLRILDGTAVNACGFNGRPNDIVMTACNAPAAPTLSGVTRTGTSTMRLNSFSAVSGADGYLVQITENGTFDNLPNRYDEPFTGSVSTAYGGSGSQVVANVASPVAIDVTGLTQGNSYSFKVTPYVNCLSLYQMGAAATTTASPTCGVPPNSPTNFITSSANPTSLNFQSFDGSVGGASGYVSYINTTNSFVAPTALPTPNTTYNTAGQHAIYVGTSTTPSVTISGSAITAGTTYFIRTYSYEVCDGVFYFDPTGGLVTPQVCGGTPSAPSVLSITGISHSSFNVSSISPVSGAGGYVVMINTSNSFTAPMDGTALPGASSNYTGSGQQVVYAGASASPGVSVTGLDNSNGGVTYYFRAYAYNLCEGNYYFGTAGASATATTRGAVQTVASDAVFFEVGDTFMDLNSFTGAIGATGHVIKMNTVNTFSPPADGLGALPAASTNFGGSEQVVYAGTSTSPDIRITGLSAATTYFFEIYTYTDVGGLLFYNQTGHNFSQQNVKPAATVTFNDFTVTYGDADFDLSASSNATGAFTYQLVSQSTSGTSLTGSTVDIGNAGTVLFQVTQAADANFNPATVSATMTIDKADPVISFDPVTVNFGTGDQTLNASAQILGSAASASTGTITYNIEGVAPGGNTLSGTNNATWTPGDPGTFTIRASIAADDNYHAGFTNALFTVSAEATTYFATASILRRISNGTVNTLIPFSPVQPSFGYNPVDIRIINDKIWGVNSAGGTNGKGTIYTVNLDGTGLTVVANIPTTSESSAGARAPQLINGKVWVVAGTGGANGYGEIYTLDTDGSNFQTVYSFDVGLRRPVAELIEYNGRIYGSCVNEDANTFFGGIYSLNNDGSGGYIEEFATTTANNRTPIYGLISHDGYLWYTNQTSLVAYDPVNKTTPISTNLGSGFASDILLYNNDLYIAKGNEILRVASPYTSVSALRNLFSDGISDAGFITHDGESFYGSGTKGSRGAIYRISSDGTTYAELTSSTTEAFAGRAYNYVAKLDPVLTFDDQTVDHISVTTLNASSNSTGAITYELISDATASGLAGDQFTAGNVGTVTIRATIAEDPNFNSATQDATFTIGKIDPTFTISDLTIPFASAAQTLAPSVTNYAGGTITYQFVNGGSLVTTGPNTGSTISGNQLTVGNPGTETIRATIPSNSNFNAATVDFQLSVDNATANLLGFTDFSREIFQSDVTLSVLTAPGVSVQFDMLTSNTGSSLSGTNNEILTIGNVAGTETIRVTVTEPNYNATTKDITFTLNKVTPAITWATPADISFAVEPLDTDRLNATASVPGTFEYWLDEASEAFGSRITPGVTTLPAIGARTLVAEFTPTDNANYASTTFSVVIIATKVQLEITLDDQTLFFGEAEPALSYTITNGAIIPGHTLFLPITRAGGNTLGTYAITEDATVQSTQTDGESAGLICPFGLCIWGNGTDGTTRTQLNNYEVTVVPGTLTINRIPVSNQTVAATPSEGICEVPPAVSLSASQAGIDYYLRDDADNSFIQGPVEGTGSAIAFASETLSATKTYNVIGVPQSDPAFSLQLDNDDGFISVASPQAQLNADAITVETWAYIPSTDDMDQYSALITNEFDGSNIIYQVSLINGKMVTGFFNGAWRWTSSGVGVDYPKDQWIHIASTYDRNNIRLYINGQLVDELAEAAALPLSNTLGWRLGRRWDSPQNATYIFGGALANTRIWNVTRSSAEISSNMSKVITSATGLVASYSYTNGSGTTISDRSGYEFDGTLQAMPGDATNWIVSPEALEMTDIPTVSVNNIQDQTVQLAQPNSSEVNISLTGSQVGVNYFLRNDLDNLVLQGPIAGTGSSIAFVTQPITGTTTFNVLAESISGTCSLEMGNTVTSSSKVVITMGDVDFTAPASLVFDGSAKIFTAASTYPPLPTADLLVTYEGRNGTVYANSSTAPTDAGDYTVIATVIASNPNYEGSLSENFSITPAAQTITFNALADRTFGVADFTLSATGGASGNGITFVSSNTAVATVIGNTVTIVGVGTTNITASQLGNSNYLPGMDVVQPLQVNQASQTITFGSLADVTFGDSNFELTGTATSGLSVTYVSSNTDVATVSGTTVTIVGAGTTNITASQSGNTDFNAAMNIVQSLTVNKATATVTLNDLTQTFDGTARAVTATTNPTGLTVDITYDGLSAAPTNAGTFPIVGTINDSNYEGTASGTLTVNKATATVTLNDLTQTFDGTARAVTATTNPSGLTVDFTYDGLSTVPTNAGTYAIVGIINDVNYTGSASGTLTVNQATATVTLNDLTQTFDGIAKVVTATTNPSGLTVDFTYDGLITAPTNAGTYAIVGTINDANYTSSASGMLTVNKASATVTLNDLTQTFDGSARVVTATTNPSGLIVDFTYDGLSTAPTNAGTYAIVGTINDANYSGSASGSLTVNKATATVTLNNLNQIFDGTAKVVTATTNPAGLMVDFTYDGLTVVPTNAGSYAVVGTINDGNYEGTASGTLIVSKATATVTLSDLMQTFDGNPASASASTNPVGLTVNFTYDGGVAIPVNAGSYAVVGTIDDSNYEGSASGTLIIGQATAGINISDLSQIGDGTPKLVTVTTTPSGLNTEIFYTGINGTLYSRSSTAPSATGEYEVEVNVVMETNYTGTQTATLEITDKIQATVNLTDLVKTFNNTPQDVTVTTEPLGLTVDLTYTGTGGTVYGPSSVAPTNAGTYSVSGVINDVTYAGSASETLTINKAVASVIINSSDLTTTFDGIGKVVATTTTPMGLAVDVTYDGGTAAPINAGTYAIIVTINDDNYTGASSGTLTINKATATVSLSDLSQVFDGAPKSPTTATTPSGLTVNLTYDGNSMVPSNAGSYAIVATIDNQNYEGTAMGNFTIAKASAIVTLTDLMQTFDGMPKSAGATTNPEGLTVEFTYDGGVTAPTNAGSYAVVGTINDANYEGSASGTLDVGKATATVTLNDLVQTFDGSARVVTGTSNPLGLTVDITYNGLTTAPTDAGTYTVEGTINDVNYEGNASSTLTVNKATASVMITDLLQIFDSSPKSVSTTTTPSGLTVDVTYEGISGTTYGPTNVAPTDGGIYQVTALINEVNYDGTATETLTIRRLPQAITFNTADKQNLVETTTLTLSASGGASGNPITFSLASTPAASLAADGVTLTLLQEGMIEITAMQAATVNYEPAIVTLRMTIEELYIWQGGSWNSGSTPPMNKNIQFNSGFTLTGDFVAANTEVLIGTLTIADGATYTSNGDFTNNSSVLIESGGSMVFHGSALGSNYTIERNATFDSNTGRYSVVGSPIQAAGFQQLGANALVYGYDETELYDPTGTAGLDRFKTPAQLSETELAVGRAYFTAYPGDVNGQIVFGGAPNHGAINVALSYTDQAPLEETPYEGFNLVSNPFTHSISYSGFIAGNTTADISGSIYLWDDNNSEAGRGDNADYLVVNAIGDTDSRNNGASKWDGNIRSGQGFFVQATAATNITFESSMLGNSNSDGGFFRLNEVKVSPIKLRLSDDQNSKATIVGFADDASVGTDSRYDALQLSNSDYGFYSLLNERAYAIQGLPMDYSREVPLGLTVPGAGNYTISINDLESDIDLEVIFLKDKQTGAIVNLREGSYNFTATAGRSDERFVLQAFPERVTKTDERLSDQLYSYTDHGRLHVVFKVVPITIGIKSGTFTLHDLNGKVMVSESSEIDNSRWSADVSRLPVNVYILTVHTDKGIWRQKVMIE